jgi:hypothetical protein
MDGSIPDEYEGVDKLREVTLILDPSEMEMIAQFFCHCATESEQYPEWDHEHLRDFLWKIKFRGPDIVVYKKTQSN